ncbi:hypothetical protein BTVI_07042 [Pitangus sulphuratus]|nr:hypothetical protein BTVI_07042 [Pitangus sulphuratus]
MFKGKVPSRHHGTDVTWSKWIVLIMQHARIGNPNCPGILEIIINWPEGANFGPADEEEGEQVVRAEEAPAYNHLPEEETHYALFTDGSCRIVGMKGPERHRTGLCSLAGQGFAACGVSATVESREGSDDSDLQEGQGADENALALDIL